jgi:uncharacterized protein YdeI (YjbR/CyaY-like superfamily)
MTESEIKPKLRRRRNPMPFDVRKALTDTGLMSAYRARPAYQQNDYVGWISQAKLAGARRQRMKQMLDELASGDRYMKQPYRARGRR